MTLILEVFCQLGGVGGFTAALKAAHEDDAGRLGGKVDPGVVLAHEVCELFVDDFDDLLGGSEAFQDLLPDGPFADGLDKVLDDLVVDVGFQQSHFDFPHGVLDVAFVELAFAFQLFKGGGEFF